MEATILSLIETMDHNSQADEVFGHHKPRTPAMAAELTDHVWSVGEFLLFRVPPWRQEGMAA